MARYGLSILAALALPVAALQAGEPEEWSAVQKASGWASFDRDGSCTFYDAASKRLINWSWEAGVLGQLDLSKLSARPEKWVLDSGNNAWAVSGTSLHFVDKRGSTGTTLTLPAEVGDLAWDARSFVLSYRTPELYLEKRDLKTGAVLWSYGPKPAKGTGFARNLHRIAIKEDGEIIVASGSSLSITTFDGAKGKVLGTTNFNLNGGEAPALTLGQQDRSPILWWLGTNIALTTVPASQVPELKLEGLLVVRLDFAEHTVSFQPSGLAEGHVLAGLLDKVAVFRTPGTGLAFITLD